ncbi:TonB-dependent receptor [Maribacter litoralis]|uniref:Outer membrane receptor proteins, mostly Fe transport n=1 Tax=Maribacter litoralis TaxID=2059726 RepID=A0A653S5N5_9FLAO|nr:TonB-dependent receptor [Maribacter litoralis]VXB60332.1 conserved hypothetical protein [Maribacter litoralis]
MKTNNQPNSTSKSFLQLRIGTSTMFLLLSLLYVFNSWASTNHSFDDVLQESTITGTIKDERGEPLPGATVQVVNTTIGSVSDFDGNYTITIPNAATKLLFSYSGFAQQEVLIEGKTTIDITLIESALSLEEVVLTGTTNPRKKIESSVAISTLSVKEMESRVIRNSADLLKSVPGLWVESTGGDGPGNVRVRGFPDGGYAFMGIMEDGLPVFQAGTNSIPSPDQFFKVDATIKQSEAIRGGTAPIIMQGAAGALVNNITKTGGNEFEGLVKISTSPNQDMYRLDLNLGGPISEGLHYNIGGFLRTDDGVYDYGYAANKGGQIKANVVKYLDKGSIRVYTKFIHENVNWNLTSPYIFNKNGDLGDVPGFDNKKDGAGLNGADTQYSYTLPSGEVVERDVQDGFYTNLISGGFEFKHELGNNWFFKNNFRIDDITHNNDTDILTDITTLDTNNSYFYTDGTQVADVANLNGNGLGMGAVIIASDNKYKNLINRLEISKRGDKNGLTIGLEYFKYQLESSSSQALVTKELTHAPRLLIANDPNASAFLPVALLAPGGITQADGTENTFSIYITDELEVSDKLRIDTGFRYDHKSLKGNNFGKEGSSIFAGGAGYTIGDPVAFDESQGNWVASIGLNYKFNEGFALFARGSRGYNGLKLGDFTADAADPTALSELDTRVIRQGEVGFKYSSPSFGLFSSLIYADVNNLAKSIAIPGPSGLVSQQIFISSRTISAEIEASYKIDKNFNLRLITTIQDPEYTDLTFTANEGTFVEGQTFDWAGNTAERVPKLTADMTINYSAKKLNAFTGLRYYSKRWSTPANNVELKGFSEVYVGAGYNFSKSLNLNFNVANLFNSIQLTEGNTRGDQFVDIDTIDGTPRLGRRNLPRTFFINMTYKF